MTTFVCVFQQNYSCIIVSLNHKIKWNSHNDGDSVVVILIRNFGKSTYETTADLRNVMHFNHHQKMANLELQRWLSS